MAEPLSLIMGGISLISGLAAQSEQTAAYQAAREEKIRSHEYNIKLAEEERDKLIAGFKREGATYARAQSAAIGASGAEISGGTPLMSMIETAASIERDIAGAKRAAQLEIEWREEEIEALKPKKKKLTTNPSKYSDRQPSTKRPNYAYIPYPHGGGPGAR